jgi:hypothetical protein
MSADLRGRAIGPGACAQAASGMGVARLGQRPLATVRAGGRRCGDQPQEGHARSWALQPGQGTHGRPQGHGHGARPPAPGWQGLAHGGDTPGWHGRGACLRQTLQACGLGAHGTALCVQDAWLGRRGAPHCREPRRGAGPPGARPLERRAGRSPKALRRHGASVRARRASARTLRSARMATSSTVGPDPAVRAPARARRAHGTASRRSVVTRSPGLGASGRGPPPSTRSLFACESGRAKRHRGPLRRRRAAVGPGMASCGRGDRYHRGACPWCRGRGPRRRDLAPHTPRPSSPGGPPGR